MLALNSCKALREALSKSMDAMHTKTLFKHLVWIFPVYKNVSANGGSTVVDKLRNGFPISKSGIKRNGSLLYTIRPIQAALDLFYARQIVRMDKNMVKQRAAGKQATLASVSPCEPLCGPLESAASPSLTEDGLSGIEAVSDEMKDERKSGIKDRHRKRHPGRAQLPAPRAVTGDSQVR